MNELYQLLKELIDLKKINPKTRKRIKVIAIVLVMFSIIFLTIKNNFFNKDLEVPNINITESDNAIVTTGNQNNIILDKSSDIIVKDDTNTKEIIEGYLSNPDIFYEYYTIKKEGYNPYYLCASMRSDSIFFESFKVKNEKVNLLNRLKARELEFIVGSWKFEPKLNDEYLVFNGCKPHNCGLEFGIYAYSLKYDEGFAISTNDTIGFTITKLPRKVSVMCDFENIILSERPELINLVQTKGSIFDYLPSRKLPNLLDSINYKDQVIMSVRKSIQDTLKNPQLKSSLEIYGLYRENFFNNGLCWLSACAMAESESDYVIYTFHDSNFNTISSFRSSYVFGDAGDVYLVKQENGNLFKSLYIMIVKDCGGTSGTLDIWMYRIDHHKLIKISNESLIKNYLKYFEIDNYNIN